MIATFRHLIYRRAEAVRMAKRHERAVTDWAALAAALDDTEERLREYRRAVGIVAELRAAEAEGGPSS